MLAFLGASHTHTSNSEYSNTVRKAIDFLTEIQDPTSGHFGDSSAYSHAIATYALAECYALTQDPGPNAPGQDALALRRLQVNHDESLAVFACRVTGLLRPRGAA